MARVARRNQALATLPSVEIKELEGCCKNDKDFKNVIGKKRIMNKKTAEFDSNSAALI